MFNSRPTADSAQTFSLHTPVLTTERLVLRPPVREDAEELAVIANAREIAEMTRRMPYPYTQADANAFIDQVGNGYMEGHIYAVTLAETGHLIGMTSVERRQTQDALEVGYWLGKKWWGHGYASEACTAVVGLAFRVTGADTIFATSRPINTASKQILLKQGFAFVGRDEVQTIAAGRVQVDRYRLSRNSWLETKSAN